MESQIKELENNSRIVENLKVEEVFLLSEDILNDCQLKKGKKAKFIKYMQKIAPISENIEIITDQSLIVAVAGLFKNLGKLGEHQQCLQKAIQILSKLQSYKSVIVRWLLQIAALKSSKKQHQECYEISVKAFKICQQVLTQIYTNYQQDQQHQSQFLFVQKIIELSKQSTKDQIIWLVNQRSIAQEMLAQIQKSCEQIIHIPYYPTEQFHIADFMSLEECPKGWEQIQRQTLKQIVIYSSICCFTMATEKYYLKDYSQKYNHLKSLKIALCSFDINCSYVSFLLKILNQHFGKRLQSIEQQHSQTAQRYQMRRIMPKDTKEFAQ